MAYRAKAECMESPTRSSAGCVCPPAPAGLETRIALAPPAVTRQENTVQGKGIGLAPPALHPVSVPRATTPVGLPDGLRQKTEALSGIDLSSVRVHHASAEPARLGALAFTRGTDIHLGPGQDAHLPHEAWHVVQQKQGRVRPTMHLAGAAINHDASLEREADAMAARLPRLQIDSRDPELERNAAPQTANPQPAVVQRMIALEPPPLAPVAVASAAPGGAAPDKAAIEAKDRDIASLMSYALSIPVNTRGQTFSQAVKEFIALHPSKPTLQAHWKNVDDWLKAEDKTKADPRKIRQDMVDIRKEINDIEQKTPSHPNKANIQPQGEEPGTIPQSDVSHRIANELKTEILKKENEVLYKDHKNNSINKGFMLGVLVLPSGKVLVAHSGFWPTFKQQKFNQVVGAAGYQSVSYSWAQYNDLAAFFHQSVTAMTLDPSRFEIKQKTGGDKLCLVETRGTKPHQTTEEGNLFASCAAPQLMGKNAAQIEDKDLLGNHKLALTEIWVHPETSSKVPIRDAAGKRIQYSDTLDVPSCVTCQKQLIAGMQILQRRVKMLQMGRQLDEEIAKLKARADKFALAMPTGMAGQKQKLMEFYATTEGHFQTKVTYFQKQSSHSLEAFFATLAKLEGELSALVKPIEKEIKVKEIQAQMKQTEEDEAKISKELMAEEAQHREALAKQAASEAQEAKKKETERLEKLAQIQEELATLVLNQEEERDKLAGEEQQAAKKIMDAIQAGERDMIAGEEQIGSQVMGLLHHEIQERTKLGQAESEEWKTIAEKERIDLTLTREKERHKLSVDFQQLRQELQKQEEMARKLLKTLHIEMANRRQAEAQFIKKLDNLHQQGAIQSAKLAQRAERERQAQEAERERVAREPEQKTLAAGAEKETPVQEPEQPRAQQKKPTQEDKATPQQEPPQQKGSMPVWSWPAIIIFGIILAILFAPWFT